MTFRGADARTPWLSHGGGVRRGWASHFSISSPRSTNHTGVQPIQGPSGFCREESQAIKTPSKSIKIHQNLWQFSPCTNHQNPSESFKSLSESIKIYQNPSKSIRIHQNPSKSVRIHQNRSESINIKQVVRCAAHQNPSESTKIHQDSGKLWFAGHHLSNLQDCEASPSHQFWHRLDWSFPESTARGL